jgi:TatD DNase family protein
MGEVENGLKRGLYFGINGIMTFTKDDTQLAAAKAIPLDTLMLETDAPFLTPTPLRGTMNQPANVRLVAAYLAEMRGETLDLLIEATTKNAQKLFSLNPSEIINI